MTLPRHHHALTRRELMAGTASALLLASCHSQGAAVELDALFRYVSHRVPLPAKRALGARFLEQQPEENDLESLVRLVFGERSGPSEVDRWIDHFDDAVAADFARGRLLLVEGWLATWTEMRFCALAHLLSPS